MGKDTLVWGGLKLRAYVEEGIVRKAEHWSETHVSGYVEAPYVYSGADGQVQSSGGGGSIGSRVHNWSRFYIDTGQGRESVVKLPGEFAAREGHRLTVRTIETGRRLHPITVSNGSTGAVYRSGYDGSDVVGNPWLRRLFLVLTVLAGLYGALGVLAAHGVRGSLQLLSYIYEPTVLALFWPWFWPMVMILVAGWLLTLPYRWRARAVRRFIDRVRQM